MQNRLSTMRGNKYLSNLLDSSRQGFVLTSIKMVFMCSSRIKSYPKSSKVNFYDKNFPLTDLKESTMCLFMANLKEVSNSSCDLPST